MAGIKLGSTTVNKIYLGSTEIKAAYLGSIQVWGSSTPETQDSISLDKNSLVFSHLGGFETNVTVTASGSGSYSNTTSGINCTVNNNIVTISCENNNSVNSRTSTIIFSCGNASTTLNIIQDSSVYIRLSETSPLIVSPSGDSKAITVYSSNNGTCVPGANGEGVVCDNLSGSNNSVVTISCQANNSGSIRTTTLQFNCNSASTSLTIEQDAIN